MVTMIPRGWTPEGTATYQHAAKRLREWMDTPPRACLWCGGQEVIWHRSDAFGTYLPVTCPECGPRRDG